LREIKEQKTTTTKNERGRGVYELKCPGMLSGSCSNSGTGRVTLVENRKVMTEEKTGF